MCDLCGGSKQFSGRVEHYRWSNINECSATTWTGSVKRECWQEGSRMPCPHCCPEVYGKVTMVVKRKE